MVIDRATIITRNRNDLARPYRGRLDTALLNQENEVRRKVQERVETFGVKEDKILADRSRSDEGKHTAIVALVNDSLESFGFLGRVVADLEGDAQQTRANIRRQGATRLAPIRQLSTRARMAITSGAPPTRCRRSRRTGPRGHVVIAERADYTSLVTDEVKTRPEERRGKTADVSLTGQPITLPANWRLQITCNTHGLGVIQRKSSRVGRRRTDRLADRVGGAAT
jgi:hypothetical protein